MKPLVEIKGQELARALCFILKFSFCSSEIPFKFLQRGQTRAPVSDTKELSSGAETQIIEGNARNDG